MLSEPAVRAARHGPWYVGLMLRFLNKCQSEPPSGLHKCGSVSVVQFLLRGSFGAGDIAAFAPAPE